MPTYDLIIKNIKLVRPNQSDVIDADIAVSRGKIAKVGPAIPAEEAKEVYDAKGLLAFPGLVDGHMHVGIYQPLAEDAITESKAAAMGGVTSAITYFRTGEYYLNKSGAYKDFYPEVLEISKDKYWVDYAYHLAPINRGHIDELPMLLDEHGVIVQDFYVLWRAWFAWQV
ncbi:MAG TPA: hypothetical protein VIS72_15310 [Anaerolineales bacterium]